MDTQRVKKFSKLYQKKMNSQKISRALSLVSHRIPKIKQANYSNYLLDISVDFFKKLGEIMQPVWQDLVSRELAIEITSEIDRIYDLLLKSNYSSEYARVTRYVLFSVADDLIGFSLWGVKHHWEQTRLLKKIYHDEPDQDKFFLILEKILQESHLYIDLLECMYVCLQMGYRGIYRADQQADNISSWKRSVYHCICLNRGRVSQRLLISQVVPIKPKNSTHFSRHLIVLWSVICLALGSFVVGGFWMKYRTQAIIAPLSKITLKYTARQ